MAPIEPVDAAIGKRVAAGPVTRFDAISVWTTGSLDWLHAVSTVNFSGIPGYIPPARKNELSAFEALERLIAGAPSCRHPSLLTPLSQPDIAEMP